MNPTDARAPRKTDRNPATKAMACVKATFRSLSGTLPPPAPAALACIVAAEMPVRCVRTRGQRRTQGERNDSRPAEERDREAEVPPTSMADLRHRVDRIAAWCTSL